MTDYCRIPLEIKPCLFISCFKRANIERSLIIHLEEKPYCSFVPTVWWHGYIETIKIFQNSHLGGTDGKSCSFWPAEALAKNWCY